MNLTLLFRRPARALCLGSLLLAAPADLLASPVLESVVAARPERATLQLAAAKSDKTATTIKNVDAKAAAKLLTANTNIVIIDVRTPEEFISGHIAGATNINFNAGQFSAAIEKLDRDKTYLVHCAAGGRSKRSLESFKSLGFKSIIHLDGGFNGWEAAGKPVAK